MGFLTVCDHRSQGLFGGYLILNSAGRPLEFHCTAPVRPSRAQEILYGAALHGYLCGEQIGQALLEKAKTPPLVVFTDVAAVLTVRDFTSLPVACVLSDRPADDEDSQDAAAEPAGGPPSSENPDVVRLDAGWPQPPAPLAQRLFTFSLGNARLAVPKEHHADAELVLERWKPLSVEFDLHEPFHRIREAIDEARRSAIRTA